MNYLDEGTPVVIWGCGEIGRKVYWAVQNIYDIRFFADSKVPQDSTIGGGVSFYGYPVHHPSVLAGTKGKHVVIVAIQNWEQVVPQLQEYGLEPLIDYIPHTLVQYNQIDIDILRYLPDIATKEQYVDKARAGKKLFITYGMCHMQLYERILLLNKEFSEQYILFSVPSLNFVKGKNGYLLSEDWYWRKCDLLIHHQLNRMITYNPHTNQMKNVLRPDCIRCCVTPAACNVYFPQGQEWPQSIAQIKYMFSSRMDKFITQMIQKGLSKEEIRRSVLSENFLDTSFIMKHRDTSFKVLELAEQNCDIKIADYIKENYAKEILFYSVVHPTENVMIEIANRILMHLGFKKDLRTNYTPDEIPYIWNHAGIQVVYPCVAAAYGITHIVRNRVFMFWNTELTLEQFIDEYIAMNAPCSAHTADTK